MSEIPNFDGGSVSKLVNYFEGRSQVQAGLGGRYYLNVGFSPTEIIKFGIVKDYSPNFTHHAIFTTKLKGAFRVDLEGVDCAVQLNTGPNKFKGRVLYCGDLSDYAGITEEDALVSWREHEPFTNLTPGVKVEDIFNVHPYSDHSVVFVTKKGTVGHERQVSAATMSDAFLGEDSVLISTHSFDEGLGVKNDRCLIGVSCVGEDKPPYTAYLVKEGALTETVTIPTHDYSVVPDRSPKVAFLNQNNTKLVVARFGSPTLKEYDIGSDIKKFINTDKQMVFRILPPARGSNWRHVIFYGAHNSSSSSEICAGKCVLTMREGRKLQCIDGNQNFTTGIYDTPPKEVYLIGNFLIINQGDKWMVQVVFSARKFVQLVKAPTRCGNCGPCDAYFGGTTYGPKSLDRHGTSIECKSYRPAYMK
ncbi:uncharacterized protein LOC118433431 [Folsomia candida]|uniref:uncharacterized protein LOC118433431 n=1 Tax=Folsomia candida TaxID=158441 RepID=UPI001604B919|nr:uncharacterized protein LOC118433431 [Folsomia candida]